MCAYPSSSTHALAKQYPSRGWGRMLRRPVCLVLSKPLRGKNQPASSCRGLAVPSHPTSKERTPMKPNDLEALSDYVLNWLLTEEDLAPSLRCNIQLEQTRRSLERNVPQEMIMLTAELLHDASTCGYHGFTAAQTAIFGFKWPLPRGWLKSLIGKTIPISQYREFVEAAKIKKPK